ncbi:MAG: hypothetical protein LBE62_06620 [Azonexus sp.]|jgi:hypothetical protein|nr:hypothetical protein [Azonexus sp.]
MNLSEYINEGAKKAGSLTGLGTMLGIEQRNMTSAKAQRRGLPNDACVRLADYIGADRLEVIAANELATEKKPEKRQFWMHLLGEKSGGGLSYIR